MSEINWNSVISDIQLREARENNALESSRSGRGGGWLEAFAIAMGKLIERLAPDPVCDDCIADRLELADRQDAGIAANELAGTSQFERRRDACVLCGITKPTTRRSI